jgi:hypothetical protein
MEHEACPTCGALLNQASECAYQHGGVILDGDDLETILGPIVERKPQGVLIDGDDLEIIAGS